MKKIVSAILSTALILSCCLLSFAQPKESSARLYNYYDDGMLFKHSEEAVFAGVAKPNAEISVTLYDCNKNAVRNSKAVSDSNGIFKVSFIAPQGGFEEYSVTLTENGVEFETLENVVFGELWIACGQSNMSYPLGQSKTGIESIENGESFNYWVRALMIPFYPQNGDENDPVPSDPQTEYHSAFWTNGKENDIIGASAVGYYFADNLVSELEMPVGFLNTSLGGSSILSWLSREAIDGNEQVKNEILKHDDYIKLNKWKEDKQNIYTDMTANFNTKIAPLADFNVSGMIWYQGESDVNSDWSSERFKNTFRLIQESYTEHFGYKDGLLPVIATQLAPFTYYSEYALAERNEDFAQLHYERPDSIAVTPIHDVPLTYLPLAGAIHPDSKFEVGERMAYAALGLVYGEHNNYSTSLPVSYEVKEGSIYVKLANVGSGLTFKGEYIKGFALCAKDGIYLPAEAEIIAPDTVKITCNEIEEPVSAAYAYCQTNFDANLYATENGVPSLAVSPFVTDRSYNRQFWTERYWTDCENNKIWHTHDNTTSGYFDAWAGNNAHITYTADDSYSGVNGLNIKSDSPAFSINPVTKGLNEDGKPERFYDNDHNYTNYGTMSFFIRNNANNNVTLKNVEIWRDNSYKYTAAIDGTSDVSADIPADGKWHKITVNLNKLYLNGNDCGIAVTNNKLTRTTDFIFNFECEGEADLSFDHVRFTAENGNEKPSFDPNPDNAETFLEKISLFFTRLIGAIASIFI